MSRATTWLLALVVGLGACSDDSVPGDGAVFDSQSGDGPPVDTASIDGTPTGDGGTSSWVKIKGATDCPHVDLGNKVPVTYHGSTLGLPNLVQSTRLEWKDAPDDSLIFSAPEDGDYVIYLTSNAQMSGVGASAKDYGGSYYTQATCPQAGQVTDLDGVYTDNDPNYPLKLTANQRVLIWVSAATWEPVQTPSYALRIEKN